MKKLAAEILAVAKEVVAIPMSFDAPSVETTRWAKRTLMLALRVDSSWKMIYESFLTNQEGSSNKFHYFGVFKNKITGECVGGNAYGRIGYNPKAIEVSRGSEMGVMSTVHRKMRDKQGKGYTVTEV